MPGNARGILPLSIITCTAFKCRAMVCQRLAGGSQSIGCVRINAAAIVRFAWRQQVQIVLVRPLP
jgi:hypothetical protein